MRNQSYRAALNPDVARGSVLRRMAIIAAACVCAASPAFAGHNVFHIFTPVVEHNAWGVEILSGLQSGFPAQEEGHAGEHEGEEHGHGAVDAGHEFAVHGGIAEFWMAKLALGLEHEKGGSYDLTSVAVENVFRLPAHAPSSFDAGWFTAVSIGIGEEETNAVEFGPVVTLSSGPVSVALNPFFEKTFGRNREDGIAFTYGWRATYEIFDKLSIGVEGFGEIENISNAPAAQDQVHRLGPVLYLGHVHGARPHAAGDDGHKVAHGAHEASGHEPGSHEPGHEDHGGDWHAEIGVLFGLTQATPDTAIKLNLGYDF